MKRVYCGIDLHATSMQVCVIGPDLVQALERTVRNDLSTLLSLLRPFGPGLAIAVESTFNWYWLVDGLQAAGYEVHLAHTLGLFLITKAKVKTDRRDACALARLLATGLLPEAYIYPVQTRPIRDLVRQRTRLVAARAQGYAALRLRLYQHGLHDHSRNAAKAWDPGDVEEMTGHPVLRLLCRQELERIALLSDQVARVEERIVEAAGDEPGYRRLLALPGVGRALAAVLFYETGDVGRFPSARHYSSYCRLVPGTADSGGHSKRGRGSKQGNPHLKAAFTQAAQCAVRHYPAIKAFYERHAAHHPGRGSRLIATDILAHKLALATFAILREGIEYDEQRLLTA